MEQSSGLPTADGAAQTFDNNRWRSGTRDAQLNGQCNYQDPHSFGRTSGIHAQTGAQASHCGCEIVQQLAKGSTPEGS